MVEGHEERTGREFAEVNVGQTISYGCKLRGSLSRNKLMVVERREKQEASIKIEDCC